MENQLPILLGVIIIGFIAIFFFINQKFKELSELKKDDTMLMWLKTMQVSLEETNKTLHQSLHSSNQNITSVLQTNTKSMNDRLDNAARVISEVQKHIGEMSEIGRNMKELQEFLRNPKLRGNIGEQVLKELLSQMLPKQSFHLQYAFKSGSIVDAAIKTAAGIIPIDSKFPMENFKKMNSNISDADKKRVEKDFVHDVKTHIDTISKKYILTSEGTIDYALMYVPSESIYYEIINTSTLFDYSTKMRVLPVSPMTFYAYLKAILMGFEGQEISKHAQEILSSLKAIQKEYEKVDEQLDILGKHIGNSYNMMNQVQGGFTRLGQKLQTMSTIEKQELKELEEKLDPQQLPL